MRIALLEKDGAESQSWREAECKYGRSLGPSWTDETSGLGREGSVGRNEKFIGTGVAGGF